MAASIIDGGRTQENPWKEPLTHKKLLANFLTYPHWPNLRLEPMETEVSASGHLATSNSDNNTDI